MSIATDNSDSRDLAGYQVLIVEDDYFVAHDLCDVLREHGATVHGPAPSLKRGREHREYSRYDCALLDVNLHGEFVFDLAEELKRQGVRTIFTTGYDVSFLGERLQSAAYLQKPINLNVLIEMIRAVPAIEATRARDTSGA
jgi:DNA-binding response OmpR family regulator